MTKPTKRGRLADANSIEQPSHSETSRMSANKSFGQYVMARHTLNFLGQV